MAWRVDKKDFAVGRIHCITGGNAPLTCSSGQLEVCPLTLGSLLSYSESFQGSKRLQDLSPSPSLSISGKEEMKGIGVGQRPEGESQRDYHKFTWSNSLRRVWKSEKSGKQVQYRGMSNIYGEMPEDNQSSGFGVHLTNNLKLKTHFHHFQESNPTEYMSWYTRSVGTVWHWS